MARILIPIAAGCEELEAVTLIDLTCSAGRNSTPSRLGWRKARSQR